MTFIYRSIRYLSAISALFLATGVFAQDVYDIGETDQVDGLTCSQFVTITDGDGDYEPGEMQEITICIDNSSLNSPELYISPQLYDHIWEITGDASLFVYDGPDSDSPLLGEFNSDMDPAGVNVTGSESCLTLVFQTGTSAAAGFTARVLCEQAFQDFNVDIQTTPEFEEDGYGNLQDEDVILICVGDSITAEAITEYPLSDASGTGYPQSDETSYFRWQMGDGTTYNGYGLTEISHTYDDEYGYQVRLFVTDTMGKVNNYTFYVLTSTRPNFTNIAVDDTLCIGEETQLTGGVLEQDTVGFNEVPGAILGGGILGGQTELPDGQGENYSTSINVEDFEEGQTLQSIEDLVSICMNIEHSYLGDLEAWLTCPSGDTLVIFDANGGGVLETEDEFGASDQFLGDAYDNNLGNPGIGFDYCFSDDDPEFGTFAEEYNSNTITVNSFPNSESEALIPGTYALPGNGVEDLVGCPLNGEWTLNIRDNLTIDDGYIFNWSILFNPQLNPTTVYYSPEITSYEWADNPDIIENSDTTVTVLPSEQGNNSFNFSVTDNFGCSHDTTINVYVRPLVDAGSNLIACDLTHTLSAANAVGGAEWVQLDGPGTSDFMPVGMGAQTDVEVSTTGTYNYEVTENNCSYKDTVAIDFEPNPEAMINDTTLCGGQTLTYNPLEPDPTGNYTYSWTQDGSVVSNEQTYDIDETALYGITVETACGTATDSANIVAIQYTPFVTDECGLTRPINIQVSPPGPGTWFSPDQGANISDPSANMTEFNVPSAGEYTLHYIDDRCLNDTVTQTVNFFTEPEANVSLIGDDNRVCIEEEEAPIKASVSGSFNGNYFWTVNGTEISPNNDSIFVNVQDSIPLQFYEVQAIVGNDYFACPDDTASTNFELIVCDYDIPNIITPNDDGKNDQLTINNLRWLRNARITIFDRWGTVVYEQTNFDTDDAWDAEDASDGVYYYEIQFPNIDAVETGTITVVR